MKKNSLPLWVTIDSDKPSASLEKFLLEVKPYGIILFARHLKSVPQVKELTSFIKKVDEDILLGIDQEGGRVSRLSALGYKFPGAGEANENPGFVKKTSLEMAEVLKELGFDVNFAPVVDLGRVAEGTGLEGRTYSEDKVKVKECAFAFLEGLKEFGLKGCLKHFPGLGGSIVDSHKDLPIIEGSIEERKPHLYPYEELKADFVMVAHARYRFFSSDLPSSINEECYFLLKNLKCCDTIVTDDLSMGALKDFGTLKELVRKSQKSGADISMVVCKEEETISIAKDLRETEIEKR